MKIPRIELFEWLQNNHQRAEHVLAFSKMKGLSKRDYDELLQYDLGPELDPGRGAPRGVNEFKQILMEIYGCITLYSDTDIGGLECCTNLDAKT